MAVAQPRAFRFLFFLAMAICLFAAGSAAANPGDLDPAFGNGGFMASTIGSAHAFAFGMGLAPSGRIFVSGISLTSPYTLTIGAFTPGGAFDTSFNSPYGYSESATGTGNTNSGIVATQSDGGAVVVGQSISSGIPGVAMMRFTAGGTVDTGFGTGGTVSDYPVTGLRPFAVMVQRDDKILVASQGYIPNGDLHVARYTSDGKPDMSFGGGTGAVDLTQPGGKYTTWMKASLAPSGSIYAVGAYWDGAAYSFLTARVTSAGQPDPAYNGGYIIGAKSGDVGLNQIALQPDGKSVAAGAVEAFGPSFDTLAFVRRNADGSLDSSFGNGGTVIDPVSTVASSSPDGLAVMPDGRIVALAEYFPTATSSTEQYAVMRYLPNGSRDRTFGVGGMRILTPPHGVHFAGLELQPDGKIVIAGDGAVPPANSQNGFFLMRLNNELLSPTSRITAPAHSKASARRTRKFAGTAGPAGEVATVEVALRRLDAKLLKKRKQCVWLSSPKAKFTKIKDKTKRCAPAKWHPATGTDNWTYKLKRKLPKGKYRLYVRVTLLDGTASPAFDKQSGTLRSFTLK